MNKFTKSPLPNPDLAGKENEIKEFVQGALRNTETTEEKVTPWDDLDDVEKTKGLNLRLTKADLSKLQYISSNTPYSMQAFCYESIKKSVNEKISILNKK